MKKPLRKAQYIKVKRSIWDIENFELASTVKTKFSKKEYENRRDIFESDDWRENYWGSHKDEPWFKNRNYDDYVKWGGQGDRPSKWRNEAQRKKAIRIKEKLRIGQSLKDREKTFLKTLSPELVAEILEGDNKKKLELLGNII